MVRASRSDTNRTPASFLARAAMAAGLLFALCAFAVTKVVTVPVKVAAKTVETAVDVVD